MKTVSARDRLNRKYPPSETARASEYVDHIENLDATDVVLSCRVSGGAQHRKGNLADQVKSNRRVIEKHGATVHEVYRCIESGWDNDHWMDRPTLAAAATKAKELDAVLVFESLSRLIRSIEYHPSRNPNAQPTKAEMEKVMAITQGAKLATIAHPDATPGEERSVQTQRGQQEKGRKGGQPISKKRRREIRKPEAIKLWLAGEKTARIARILEVPVSTVRDWLKDVAN